MVETPTLKTFWDGATEELVLVRVGVQPISDTRDKNIENIKAYLMDHSELSKIEEAK